MQDGQVYWTTQYAGTLYSCLQAHTATMQTAPGFGANWTGYWQIASNQLTAFTDQGLYIADGQRVLRVDGNGTVNRQVNGTQDYDPAALGYTTDPNTNAAGLVSQDFTLLTRLHQLPNGDTLVCDSGGNRVAQFDHTGALTWQYPDSDLTYQDPDQLYGNMGTTPARAAVLPSLRIPTSASLRTNDPRDVRRYVHDVTYTLQVNYAQRAGNISALTLLNALPASIIVGSQLNITVQGVRTTTANSNFNGQFVATVNGNNTLIYAQIGPTDDTSTQVQQPATPQNGLIVTDKLIPVQLTWMGYTGPGNIRWESTLIADAGNNRILEVDRPLVRFLDTTGLDLQQLPTNTSIMLAQGYHYRPDVTYVPAQLLGYPPNAPKSLVQQTEVLADVNTLAQIQLNAPNALFAKPLMFTSALRYTDASNITVPTQYDQDFVMSNVRTGELLATVSNPVPDPYTPTVFIRTVHLSRPLTPLSTALMPQNPPATGQPGTTLYPDTVWTASLAAEAKPGTTTLNIALVTLPGSVKPITGTNYMTIGTRIAISNGTNCETNTISNIHGNLLTLVKPLQYDYNPANGNVSVYYPEPDLLLPHAAAPTLNALLKTSSLTATVPAGTTVIPVQNAAKFLLGEPVGIAQVNTTATPAIATSHLLGVITNVGASTVTVQTPLPTNPANPLGYDTTYVLYTFGQGRNEYAQMRQLDLVTLQNPTEVHALVVDQAGVREIDTDPANQGDAYFEMTPDQYLNALQDGYWSYVATQKYPTASLNELMTLQGLLSDWRTPPSPNAPQAMPAFQDVGFNPVSVLRLEPRPRTATDNATVYQQQVQYLIGQLNEKNSLWNGLPLRRTHLFTARWVPGLSYNLPTGKANANQWFAGVEASAQDWAIVDGDANYFIYPDPLAPGFPNLPGMTYPLGEPFGIDED